MLEKGIRPALGTDVGGGHHTGIFREVSRAEVDKLRSEDGSKYYACELCGSKRGQTVFITNYGNRWHVSRNCSGIRRDIRSIPISQVGERALCKRCAGRRKEKS